MFIEENSKPSEKLKAWYLFTDDFIAGTAHLTNTHIGCYIRLLCWNWNKRCQGIPNNATTYHRIAMCVTEAEKVACNEVIKEFFHDVNGVYQNERQLQEYLYITNRREASRQNGKLGGRPKKPSKNPPTPTPTTTITRSIKDQMIEKVLSKSKSNLGQNMMLFHDFWKNIKYKVSKGKAEKKYSLLNEEWKNKPTELCELYNKYYDSVTDKQYVKHPAYWLSDKKYLDEIPSNNTEKVDMYDLRLKGFKECIAKKITKPFIVTSARQNPSDVLRAIKEGEFTKQEAELYLDMKGWV